MGQRKLRLGAFVMATGHHRNGILLLPVTVEAISRFILKGKIIPEIADYLPDRFQPATAGTGGGGGA